LNVDEREVELLAELDTVVAVFEFLVCVGWVPVDSLPINDPGGDLVEELEENNTISKIIIKIVDERFNTETVHPVSVGLFFASFFNEDLDFDGSEGGPCVEEVGDEGEIEFLVPLVDVLGRDEFSAVEFFGSLKNHLGSLQQVCFLETVAVAVLGGDLSEKDGIVFGVLDISREVGDASRPSGSLQVIVEPSEKDLFDGELQEILDGLSFFQETVQFGMVDKIDAREKTNLDDLPDETKKKMGFSFDKI